MKIMLSKKFHEILWFLYRRCKFWVTIDFYRKFKSAVVSRFLNFWVCYPRFFALLRVVKFSVGRSVIFLLGPPYNFVHLTRLCFSESLFWIVVLSIRWIMWKPLVSWGRNISRPSHINTRVAKKNFTQKILYANENLWSRKNFTSHFGWAKIFVSTLLI